MGVSVVISGEGGAAGETDEAVEEDRLTYEEHLVVRLMNAATPEQTEDALEEMLKTVNVVDPKETNSPVGAERAHTDGRQAGRQAGRPAHGGLVVMCVVWFRCARRWRMRAASTRACPCSTGGRHLPACVRVPSVCCWLWRSTTTRTPNSARNR